MSVPDCELCGEHPAQCRGAYENRTEETFACGECCGHGNEDGHCQPLCACCGDVLNGHTEMYYVPSKPDDVFCAKCAEDYASGLHHDPSDDDVPLGGVS